jgi:hypothetical protein
VAAGSRDVVERGPERGGIVLLAEIAVRRALARQAEGAAA